jgi:hypothetical protein
MTMGRLADNRFFTVIQSESRQIVFIACLAIAVRVIWAVMIPTVPLSDSHAYDTFAQNIVAHGVYGWKADEPSAYWPVGTSAIYALLFGIFGHVYWPIVILNILLSVAIIAATMRIARRFYPGNAIIAGISGALLAFWPSLIMYVTVLASELPFIAALMIALDAWTSRDTSTLRQGLIAGFFFAVASYVRPTALLFPLVLGLQLLVTRDSVRWALMITAVTCLTMAALIAPWTARNYELFNAFVPISTNGGVTLWMGNHPGSTGTNTDFPEYAAGLDEYMRDKVLRQEAVAYIKSDIPGFLIGSLKRLWATYNRETIAIAWNETGIEMVLGASAKLPLKLIATSYWLALLLLALAGIVLKFRNCASILNFASDPILLLWAYFAATHAIIIAGDRYHFPSIPAVAIFAAIAIHSTLQRLRS